MTVAVRAGRVAKAGGGLPGWAWLAALTLLLALAGWRSLDNIYYDTIAYLRIAGYYAAGRLDLALTGYWGPLLSWLMVPALAAGLDHLVTTRLAMGVSALLFCLAARRLLRCLAVPAAARGVGDALILLFGLVWSVTVATPDLLMAALVQLGLGWTLGPDPAGAGSRPFAAGLCYGAAYLAKAVALPVTVAMLLLIAAVRWRTRAAEPGALLRRTGWSLAGVLLVAAPWIALLSWHYGKPIVSSSGPIAHAIVGPDNPDRLHPLHHRFQPPSPGRLSTWEDPAEMDYPYWSPFRSLSALAYQARLTARNLAEAASRLGGFDWLRLGLLGTVAGFLLARHDAGTWRVQRWRLGLPVIAAATLPYALSLPDETRYYLLCWPLLLAAALGFALTEMDGEQRPARRRLLLALIALSFVAGLRYEMLAAAERATDPAYRVARALAPVLARTDSDGPLASVSDGGVAYYLSFLLGRPYIGDKIDERDPDAAARAGAALLVTRTRTPLARQLAAAPPAGLERLDVDPGLPVLVYRVRPPVTAPSGG